MAEATKKKTGRQDPVGRAFGDRVRTLREQSDLTLDQLSKLSEVSRAMLSQVERGGKSPTIGIAKRIAHGLGASFSALVGDESASRRTLAIVRKEQRQVFRDPETGFERYLLSPFVAGMPVEVVLHRLPAKTSTGKLPPYPAGVTKHVVAARGKVIVGVENEEITLEEGDTLYFEATTEHFFENRTSKTSEYYLIISATQPLFRRGDAG
ncbi:MAG: helix-turn-helix transcriptional regulator [Rhizobiales bacterium]|nr:helix-turn-helix transcriptional regulator [Hyphomicrobiales bacterium]